MPQYDKTSVYSKKSPAKALHADPNMMLVRTLSNLLTILIMACSLAVIPAAVAQEPEQDIAALLVRWNFQLDLIKAELQKKDVDETILSALRGQAESMQAEMLKVGNQAGIKLENMQRLLDALGPPPADNAPPEETSVTLQRGELQDQYAKYEGQQKQSELAFARANQVLQDISSKLIDQRTVELLVRGPSPLSWSVVVSAGPHLVDVLRQLIEAPIEEWAPVLAQGDMPSRPQGPLIALLVAFIVIWPIRRWLLAHYVRDRCEELPSFARKTITAIMVGLARGILPAMIFIAPLVVMLNLDHERGIAGDMVVALLQGITLVLIASGLARATLAPFSITSWRMTPFTHRSSRRLYKRIVGLSTLLACLHFINYPAQRHLDIPNDLIIFYDFVTAIVLAGFVLTMLPARLWRPRAELVVETLEPGQRRPITAGTMLRFGVGFFVLLLPITSLFGYANLSNYLGDNFFKSSLVFGLWVVLHGLVRDVTTVILERIAGNSATAESTSEAGDSDQGVLHFWLTLALDMVLALSASLVLITIWGLAWKDLKSWLITVANGIQIGSYTFSITDLLAAITVFIVILVITRTTQRIMESSIFPKTRLDIGVRNSLKAAVGYIGLIFGVMLAVSTVGLDLSNLAIIAGALSVGIGFGLQTVVNNFVSGLILLIERPVKVGDWIVVGGHEGFVKSINIRATEIESFHRASVIIPNSELLSSSLVNWTHKDTSARADIPVGVAYGSDTKKVEEILLQCAKDNPKVNSWPLPFVLFQNFGDSSLDFELRFYIAQADQVFRTSSEVRFAIDQAFRENGVEIPFPQRDIHVRSTVQPIDIGGPNQDPGDADPKPSSA